MHKEDRQIEWKKDTGYYKGRKLFEIWDLKTGRFSICVNISDWESFTALYNSKKSAKRGAERFLKRLQEVVK